MDPVGRHCALFNQGVRTGDFGSWLATFTDDATLAFEGLALPAVEGRAAIRSLYDSHPPSSPMRVIASTVDGDTAIGRFVWVAAPDTGGSFTVRLRNGSVAGLLVQLDAAPPPPRLR
jgi:hypothetical protein